MSEHEDRAFFEQMAGCRDAYRRLADCIHETLKASFVIDLGAGLGYVAGRLRELGWRAYACDLYAPEDLREPPEEMWARSFDLRVPPAPSDPWPIVVCTETAEHIPEAYADIVVQSVAARATHGIVWSAAQPGQEWPGHVNLQPAAYWLEKFAALGWMPDEPRTTRLRQLMLERHAQHEYAAANFFILTPR
jgi:hypothetical protein